VSGTTNEPQGPHTGMRVGGRFLLERPLGSGGAGMVYEALQEDLGRKVAIKLLRPELAEDTETLARFRREARAAAALGHPHIAQVLDFAEPRLGEPAYIAFELARGESLATRLHQADRLPIADAVRIARQVLAGLEAAHGAGIVHRDLKPANVFLADVPGVGETAKILDFGIAQMRDGEVFRRLTASGVVVGTPRYMSPEQVSSRPVDARSDLWAVGVLLYRMLTGRMPFDGKTGEVLHAIRSLPMPPMPTEAQIPAALEEVVARALRKEPSERWSSAGTMARALEAALVQGGPAATVRLPRPSEPERPTLPDPGLAATVRQRAIAAGHDSLRPSRDPTPTPAGLPRGPSPLLLGALGLLTLGALAGTLAWLLDAPAPPAASPPAPDVSPAAPDAPVPIDAPVPAPARGTLASYVAHAERRLGPGVPYRVATVRAVGLDRATATLDFERAEVVTELELEFVGPGGRCLHYAIDADRTEHVVAHSGCGAELAPPLPDLAAAIALGAARCRGAASDHGPVDVALRPGEGGTLIEVRERDGGWGFEATGETGGGLRVAPASCRRGDGTRHGAPPRDEEPRHGRVPPSDDPPRSPRENTSAPAGRGSVVINPWEK